MKGKTIAIVLGGVVLLLVVTGIIVYRTLFSASPAPKKQADLIPQEQALPAADPSISVDLVKSTTAANTVNVTAKGLGGKIASVAYELQYETKGIQQGVTGQSIDVTGKDSFERDIYLGTCSKNVCTPHTGVSKVNLVLVFTDTTGKQTQFSKDYTL